MSIARRFLSLARGELNSLLDLAAKYGDDGDSDAAGTHDSLHGYSAKELEEELERRRSARQEVEDAIHGRKTPDAPPRGAGSQAASSSGPRRPPFSGASGEALRVEKAYAALEVPTGADFQTVRKAYRALMRKYHPDHHTESPETQRAANEIAQRLTDAYRTLEKNLRT
jgi:DnaJ-domain-containing protein 1